MAESYAAEWVLSKSGDSKEKHYDDPQWGVNLQAPNLAGLCTFLHTCTANLADKQIMALPGSKEFGEGFYTTGGDQEEAYKLIAQDWFQTKQKRYDWHVIAFAMPAELLMRKLCGKGHENLHAPLLFYLTHSTGYPSGKKNPDAKDLADINAINRNNRVLIFPHDKQMKVAYEGGTETKNWFDFTANKTGGGPYRLIIGPQQPEIMKDLRQYAWVAGHGIWLINSGIRYYRCRNYQIKGERRISLNGSWPKEHPQIDANGNKVK